MNKKRLLKLADLLEADAKNKKGIKFDLGVVGCTSEWLEGEEEFVPALDCGTTACAMGLAAISGAFKRSAGLSYKIDFLSEVETTINGRRVDYDVAAMKVFDISQEAAHLLFSPSYYCGSTWNDVPTGADGERRVAKRIRDFVAGKVAP